MQNKNKLCFIELICLTMIYVSGLGTSNQIVNGPDRSYTREICWILEFINFFPMMLVGILHFFPTFCLVELFYVFWELIGCIFFHHFFESHGTKERIPQRELANRARRGVTTCKDKGKEFLFH